MSTRNPFATVLLDLFVAPSTAFADLRRAPGLAWPALLLLLASVAAATLLFFSGMSDAWIVEQQLRSVELQPVEEQAAREALTRFAPYAGGLALVNEMLAIVGSIGLLGIWYWIAARPFAPAGQRLGHWCAVATWTLMPLLPKSLGVACTALWAGSGDLPLEWLDFGRLVLLLPALQDAHAGLAWVGGLNLFSLWSFALGVCGFRIWASVPTPAAAAVSLPPYAVIALLGAAA